MSPQDKQARTSRTNKRDGLTFLVGAVCTLVASIFHIEDVETITAFQGILLILVHRGTPTV
jgi:hypothetical protein